jgi:hypothetical protein
MLAHELTSHVLSQLYCNYTPIGLNYVGHLRFLVYNSPIVSIILLQGYGTTTLHTNPPIMSRSTARGYSQNIPNSPNCTVENKLGFGASVIRYMEVDMSIPG